MEQSHQPRRAAYHQKPLVRFSLAFCSGWLALASFNGWQAGLLTLTLGAVFVLTVSRLPSAGRKLCAWLILGLPAALSWHGTIAVLTGFAGSSQQPAWIGISFVCASLAAGLYYAPMNWQAGVNCLLPWRFNSGPCALPDTPVAHAPCLSQRKRLRFAASWLLLGLFFYSVPAPALAPLLVLRHAMSAPDILVFALVFELYVYFNFSGISFMVYGLLKLFGIPVILNFQTPFAARHVPGFWQRWHITLSQVLKMLVYQPLRRYAGIWLAVPGVFLVSAMWHGVSLNFLLWGSFHALAWLSSHVLLQRGLNRLAYGLLPVTILLGRLIFSEANSAVLFEKFYQLLHWENLANSWLPGVGLSWHSVLGLLCALTCVLAEIAAPRKCRHYRHLRRLPVLACACIAILVVGQTGLGGIYGAR